MIFNASFRVIIPLKPYSRHTERQICFVRASSGRLRQIDTSLQLPPQRSLPSALLSTYSGSSSLFTGVITMTELSFLRANILNVISRTNATTPIIAKTIKSADETIYIKTTSIYFIFEILKCDNNPAFNANTNITVGLPINFEVINMDNTYANQCIACTVKECKNHHQSRNYCSLDKINIGTHENDPTVPPCTDCQSFVAKQGSC